MYNPWESGSRQKRGRLDPTRARCHASELVVVGGVGADLEVEEGADTGGCEWFKSGEEGGASWAEITGSPAKSSVITVTS